MTVASAVIRACPQQLSGEQRQAVTLSGWPHGTRLPAVRQDRVWRPSQDLASANYLGAGESDYSFDEVFPSTGHWRESGTPTVTGGADCSCLRV